MNSTNFTNKNCPDLDNQLYYYSITFVSISLNVLLFHFIRTSTNNLMIAYQKILYLSVIIDIISAFMRSLTQVVSTDP